MYARDFANKRDYALLRILGLYVGVFLARSAFGDQ
jgi:hypothetical protein